MALTTALNSIIRFLHAGYPEGIPQQDYIPLLALLRRRLTDEQVAQVADELIAQNDTDSARALATAITDVTREEPRAEDIARVRARLAVGGWPLAGLDDPADEPRIG